MKDTILSQRLVRKKELLQNHLPISLRTLNSYMERGLIPYIKIGGAIMFDVEAVFAALKKLERKTSNPKTKSPQAV